MRLLAVIALILSLLASCGGVRAGNPQPPPERFEGVAGRVVTGDSRSGVAGATVEIAGHTVVSDENGTFRLGKLPSGEEQVSVRARQQQYASAVRVFPREALSGRFITIELRPVDVMKRIDVKTGGVIALRGMPGEPNQVAVQIPANALDVNADEVDVALSVVRPHIRNELQAFPGAYAGVTKGQDDQVDLLRTFGTVEVSFFASERRLENVTLRTPAAVQLAIEPSVLGGAGEGTTIPTWSLNEATGQWIREGNATVITQNNRKLAIWQADHFSWWNLDQPLDTHACVAVQLIAENEETKRALRNIVFSLEGADYFATSYLATFDTEGLSVATGWLGHQASPRIRYIGTSYHSEINRQLEEAIWPTGTILTLPSTSGSSIYDRGPTGGRLEPMEDCLFLKYPLKLNFGTLSGTVVDSAGHPLAGALVVLPDIGHTAISTSDGSFAISGVPFDPIEGVEFEVSAIAPTSRPDLIFEPVVIQRSVEDSTVRLMALERELPPLFVRQHLSNSLPAGGSAIDFEITALDTGPRLQWGLALCGNDYHVTAKADVQDDGEEFLCHLPPGNRDNAQTLYVGSPSVEAHLAHGDTLGPCPGVDTDSQPIFEDNGSVCTGTIEKLSVKVTPKDWQYEYKLSGVWHGGDTHGSQDLEVVAKDIVGNQSAKRVQSYWRNNSPVISLSAPSYAIINDFVDTSANAVDPDGDDLTITWSFNGESAGSGQNRVTGPIAEGPNYLVVSASDGKATVTQRQTIWGTTGTPENEVETNITSGPSSPSASTTATFEFVSTTPNATFECRVDGGSFAPCAPPYVVSGLPVGTHTFAVRAVDSDGRFDVTPAFYSWDVNFGWKQYSVGGTHSCAILARGELGCWGTNASAELGLGYASHSAAYPTAATTAENDWAQVSASDNLSDLTGSTCAVKSDGSLWCWGRNPNQHLLPQVGPVTAPTRVGSSTDWQSAQVSNKAACALKEEGSLWCWGINTYYRLGLGLTGSTNVPTQVDAAVAWKDYSLGGTSACGIAQDGSLWCWGDNTFGQLGMPSASASPKRVNLEIDWAQVSVGYTHACAIKKDGSLWCWGENTGSQLGLPGGNRFAPTEVAATGYRQVSAGYGATCGIRSDGSIWCWGTESYGEFGDGEVMSVFDAPAEVLTGGEWVSVDLSYHGACAQQTNYDLYCWGHNRLSNTGAGVTSTASLPVRIDATRDWAALTHFSGHLCALDQTGSLFCAGRNESGQLGIGFDGADVQELMEVTGSSTWVTAATVDDGGVVTSALSRTCALDDLGRMYCWGAQTYENFGNGTTQGSNAPVLAATVGGPFIWRSLTLGLQHTCAIDSLFQLYCWGRSDYGQAGTTSAIVSAPREISGADWMGWTALTATPHDTCGLRNSTLYCWGPNYNGVHGNGGTTGSSTPVSTASGHTFRSIAAGTYHLCGITSDRSLWCWGNNSGNQLGRPSTELSQSNLPVAVGIDTDWDSVYAGHNYNCATKIDGSLWCWGGLYARPLPISTSEPQLVATDGGWRSIGIRQTSACGIRLDGTLWCWGTQVSGEWGNLGLIRHNPDFVAPF